MFRGILSISAGVLALLWLTGMAGQVYAQHARTAVRPATTPQVGRSMPNFDRRLSDSRFGALRPGLDRRFTDPRFGGFSPGIDRRLSDPRFGGTPFINPFGGTPNAGFGVNSFTPGTPAVDLAPIAGMAGANPFSPLSQAADPYMPNPYASSSPYSNPAAGPAYSLIGEADVLRAYGTAVVKQEQARSLRQQYYQSKLETKKGFFDLDVYIKNNTPDFNEQQEKIAKLTLNRLQNAANPAEIVDGRALNFLLDDVDKNHSKTPVSEIPLERNILKQLNIKAAGLGGGSLGMLRDGGPLNWPSALIKLLSADVRSDMEARAQALAQNAARGKTPDPAALADFQTQIRQAMDQLLKRANDFDTPPYMDGKRFLTNLDHARKAIEGGHARHQIRYRQMVAKGEIQSVNQLVSAMAKNGWRFATALQADEAAYFAVHSALVEYDLAVHEQVAQSEGN